MLKLLSRVVLVLTLAGAAAFSHAAETSLEPPDLSRYLRWGPLRVRPGISLENVGYDDNILASSSRKVDDYTLTVAPRVEGLVLFGERAFLTFDERVEYTAYAENSEQNFFNLTSAARLTVPLGRVGVFAEADLANVKERPIDQEDIRPERRERGIGAGVVARFGWRTEAELAVTERRLRYRDDDAVDPTLIGRRLNRRESGINLRASYLLTGRTSLTLDLSTEDVSFDDPSFSVGDAERRNVLPGVDFGTGGPLSGRVRLGWTDVAQTAGAQADVSGVVGDARLVYRVNPRTHLLLNVERAIGFSSYEQSRFYRTTEVGARALHYFNRLIGVELGGSRGRLTFPARGTAGLREDDLERLTVGLRLRLAANALDRRVEYAFRVHRYRRDSNLNELDNDQLRAGFDVILGY